MMPANENPRPGADGVDAIEEVFEWVDRANPAQDRTATARTQLTALRARVEALEAALAEARTDGERLDFLEERGGFSCDEQGVGMSMSRWGRRNDLTVRQAIDVAIDAASQADGQEGGR